MSKAAEIDTPWVVRGVPAHTRMKVRLYAVARDLPMGQAIAEMVARGKAPPEYHALVEGIGRVATEALKIDTDKPDEGLDSPWVVKEVPIGVRRAVKVHAALNGVVMAGALEEIVDRYLLQGDDSQQGLAEFSPLADN